MVSKMKNYTVSASISRSEKKTNYRKKSNVRNITFRPMGEILKTGKKRFRNWKKRSKN